MPHTQQKKNIYSMNNWDNQLEIDNATVRIVTGNSKDKVQNEFKRGDNIGKAEGKW